MAGWETLTGAVVGVGVGEAAGTALEPAMEPLKQDAWTRSKAKVLDLGTLAALVAQGLLSLDAAVAEGARNGYAASRVERAVQLALKAAPVAELLELWRRGKISETLVDHGLAKAQIEPQYWTPIKELFYGRLDPAIVATAIQRGIMRDPGFLPVGPPTATGKVPAFPVSPLDPIEEAKASGIDELRMFVNTAIVGLPLSLQEAASAYFRGIIEQVDFERAVSEGNTRNEWGAAALEQARQILTAGEYAELELRGYYDRATRLTHTAKHGMSDADSDLLYDVQGRGMNLHQAFIAERRGGVFEGPTTGIPEWALWQLQRGNLRPEVYNLMWASRESFPSPFVIRALATDGAITPERTLSLFMGHGWPEDVAVSAAKHYAGTTATAIDPNLKKAHTKAWTEAQSSYIAEESTAADVQPIFAVLGIDSTVGQEIIGVWDEIRALVRKQLSPAQIKKAVRNGVTNPATGQPWSLADGIAALLARGYDQADAETLLAE